MADLRETQSKLERAIGRLESAQKAYARRQEARLAEAQNQPGGESEELVQRLQIAQRRNDALLAERNELADRIDQVIGRLRAALDNGTGDTD